MAPRYLALALLSLVTTPALAVNITDPAAGVALHSDNPKNGVFDAMPSLGNGGTGDALLSQTSITEPVDPDASDFAGLGQPKVTFSELPASGPAPTTVGVDLLPGSGTQGPAQPVNAIAPVNAAQPASLFQPGIWAMMLLGAGTVAAVIRQRRFSRQKSRRRRSGRGSR